MTAVDVTAEQVLYGVVQTPLVVNAVAQDNAAQAVLYRAIWQLQSNPRPDGYQSAEEFGAGLTSLTIAETTPPYIILYQIDEGNRRVVVMAVFEKRFSETA